MGTTNIIWQNTRIHEDSSQVINCTSCGLLFSAMNANKDHTDRSHRKTAERLSQQNTSIKRPKLLRPIEKVEDAIPPKKTGRV